MADGSVKGAAGLWAALGAMALRPAQALDQRRGQLLPLAVVSFGTGIGLWFGLATEPGRGSYLALAALILGLGLVTLLGPELLRPVAALAVMLALGFADAGLRAAMQQAPVLGFRYFGAIEGRIIEIDRSSSDALRLTLDQPVLTGMAPDKLPQKLRISLLTEPQWLQPLPGQRVMLTGFLAAPAGPTEPGGFDFQRMAYFDRLGAVGYSRSPVLLLEPPEAGAAWIGRLRSHFASAIRAVIPGQAGAFAAGAMTGDRSGIAEATVAALRASSLAHILAISGMNLACLTGFVFGLIRGALALVPYLALRLQTKKLAAVIALPVAWFYLQLSGANLATERAFVMICVMLGAVLLDRRAISLRSAAIAALVVLASRPESLLAPGFQMSMAATLGLIVGFQALERGLSRRALPRALAPVLTAMLGAVIGGLTTAPYAAAQFNRFAEYGLLANFLTIPVLGLAIMPMGVLALLLAPFGLAFLPLWVMGLAARWILYVAELVAGLAGAERLLAAPHPLALPLFSLGMLWWLLWSGRGRHAGGMVAAFALALWPLATRPALILSEDAALAGLIGPEGRSLSRSRGNAISAKSWLERDGDGAAQKLAAKRSGFRLVPGGQAFALAGQSFVLLHAAAGAAALAQSCTLPKVVVVLDAAAEAALAKAGRSPPAACALIRASDLRRSGALAVSPSDQGGLAVTPARRDRIWSENGKPFGRFVLPGGLHWAGRDQ